MNLVEKNLGARSSLVMEKACFVLLVAIVGYWLVRSFPVMSVLELFVVFGLSPVLCWGLVYGVRRTRRARDSTPLLDLAVYSVLISLMGAAPFLVDFTPPHFGSPIFFGLLLTFSLSADIFLLKLHPLRDSV